MKSFLYGLTAGLAAGVTAQVMIAKNHEQMLKLVKGLKSNRYSLDDNIDELKDQKNHLEALIREKESEDPEELDNIHETGEIV